MYVSANPWIWSNISLCRSKVCKGSVFCTARLVKFRHEKHLVTVRKQVCFCLKNKVSSSVTFTNVENTGWKLSINCQHFILAILGYILYSEAQTEVDLKSKSNQCHHTQDFQRIISVYHECRSSRWRSDFCLCFGKNHIPLISPGSEPGSVCHLQSCHGEHGAECFLTLSSADWNMPPTCFRFMTTSILWCHVV